MISLPYCHFEDITRADFYGFVVPFANELHTLSMESGIPIKIRCCDTMGLGVTYPGASLPRSVQGIIYGLMQYADFFDVSLDYIFGRTDNPQGKLYQYQPKIVIEDKRMQDFIEMCFDPNTEANAKLKKALLSLLEEQK